MSVAEQQQPPTFHDLAAGEPDLAELLAEARMYQGTSHKYCANAVWFARPNGLGARARRALGIRPSWDTIRVAEETIFSALPPCRHKQSCDEIMQGKKNR